MCPKIADGSSNGAFHRVEMLFLYWSRKKAMGAQPFAIFLHVHLGV
jgi:hypothetical protein